MDLLSQISLLYDSLTEDILQNLEKTMDYEEKLRDYYSKLKNFTDSQKSDLCNALYLTLPNYSKIVQTYVLSFLAHVTPSIHYTRELIQHCSDDTIFTAQSQFYFYYQISHKRFVNTYTFDVETSLMLSHFYQHIYHRFKSDISDEMTWIPANERNKNFIVVLTSQLISLSHGPTKTTYDRCYVLQKNMNKQLFLINTSEAMSYIGFRPFFSFIIPSYSKDLLEVQEIEYLDASYPFFQYDITSPSVSTITDLLSFIQKNKPYCIFTIGGSSILSDMCSNLVPTASISLGPSDLTTTEGTFQVIGREITNEDITFVEQLGKTKDYLLSCTFTSSFRTQTTHYTRSELGLPENKCLALIVGARLDEEILDDFLELMVQTVEHNVFYVFAGSFNGFEQCMKRFPALQSSCCHLGYVDDVLALNECCDIYVNPRRLGGGTSVAEALYKGLPAVTLDYGDVGVGAGKDFHVADYDEMKQTIIRYATDKEFYSTMSKKAIARANVLTDSTSSFSKILPAMEQSPLFINAPD